MKIQFFCPIWGMVPDYIDKIDGSLEPVLLKIASAGYDGVEMAIPNDKSQKQELQRLLNKSGLGVIALQWASHGNNLKEYLASYEQCIVSAAEIKPCFINSHTGKDYFTYKENCSVIQKAIQLEERLKIKIVHEIHRSRFTFHSCSIQKYLDAYPDLRLAADFSHWCTVSESYLQDQKQNVQNAIRRSDHIHARVGHPQAAQVSDPRAPEWQQALASHLEWWDEIINYQKTIGTQTFTITPEFGPIPYMSSLPYTQQPLSSQWEINFWMKDLLKNRYSNK